MGSKAEKLEVALAQNSPFEDEVVELAPKLISTEARERLRPRAAEAAATALRSSDWPRGTSSGGVEPGPP